MSQEVIEKLRALYSKLPERFSREHAVETIGLLGVLEQWINPVKQVRELLSSSEMEELIDDGNVTIAMIKPRLDLHMNTTAVNFNYDAGLADFLTDQIPADLEPVLSVSFQMTEAMLNEFYAGELKQRMQDAPKNAEGQTRWEMFQELMESGPVTFLILHSPEGDAIDTWRKAMGTKWNIDYLRENEPDSLRAKYALTNDNNLLHGSDSPESALKELNFIIRHMK